LNSCTNMLIIIVFIFDEHFNFLNKFIDFVMIYIIDSFVFIIVLTIIFVVIILIISNFLNVNVVAICIALILRTIFIKII